MGAGFSTLREFVVQRPTLRDEGLGVLLELTTHQGMRVFPLSLPSANEFTDKVTRGAAINTIKRWVPDVHPMDAVVRDFALQLLRRLQSRPPPETKPTDVEMDGENDENMEEGQLPAEAIVHTPYLAEQLELPASRSQVLQHLELMFALTVKVPDFLDEYVASLPTPIHADILTIGCLLHMDKWTSPSKLTFKNSSPLSFALLGRHMGSF